MEPRIEIPTVEDIRILQEQVVKYGGDPGADAYYGSVMTHILYLDSDRIPHLDWQEVIVRRTRLRQLGYTSIAGVVLGSWELPVSRALSYLDHGNNHLQAGAFIGPYCWSDELLRPGIMLYRLAD
jgi:hypothetical protein